MVHYGGSKNALFFSFKTYIQIFPFGFKITPDFWDNIKKILKDPTSWILNKMLLKIFSQV